MRRPSFNAGAGQPPYTPGNYDGKYEGPVTLRRALENSRNIPAVRVMEMLGPRQVVAYAKRFGFPEDFPPYLSTALGRGRSDAARGHERVHGVSQPGHPPAAVSGDGDRSIAKATCSKKRVPRRAKRFAPTPRLS